MGSNGVLQGLPQELSHSSSYETAMVALSSLISRRRHGDGSSREEKYDLMFRYLKVLGLEEHITGLKIIHIAGTKGKGSTCTFSEAILRECGFRTGLFTSPHLIDVRERYRVNGLDISESKFLQYFWECWNKLKNRAEKMNIDTPTTLSSRVQNYLKRNSSQKDMHFKKLVIYYGQENAVDDLPMPPLFQFLTLMAFKIFLSEKVDVAILEVGLGGVLDSTNVIKEPVVCGITSLGMDHMEILGDTLGKIASEKAGIFKPCIPAFTVPQLSEAMVVLQDIASELMVPLKVASPLDPNMLNGLKLGLSGDHQFINAGLAIALCRCWLQNTRQSKFFPNDNLEAGLPESFLRGLSTASLPGRAQIVNENSSGNLVFYLDGAHSPESMEVCARWFSNAVKDDKYSSANEHAEELRQHCAIQHDNKHCNGSNKISKQILLFNCMEVRDPQLLLPQLINTCASSGIHFSKALFVPSMSAYHKVDSAASVVSSDSSKDVSWQFTLQRTWEKIVHGKDVVPENGSNLEDPENLPSYGFLYRDPPQKCNAQGKVFACSAVIPSLPMTIKWLRECVKENPSVRVQVLVTGSLHLVGDVLKLLRR